MWQAAHIIADLDAGILSRNCNDFPDIAIRWLPTAYRAAKICSPVLQALPSRFTRW